MASVRPSPDQPETGCFSAHIAPNGDRCVAWAQHTVLHSLEQAGLTWPSSCRTGSCRTCIGQLHSGQVRYNMAWPGLSAEEKAAAFFLPCVAFPLSDLVLKDPFSD